MTAKDLKNALLQEAVQGKLVPQIASEGNARDLLEEIRKEKLSHGLDLRLEASLAINAKSGKRKSKKETALDGSNPCDITEDEIPFEIPENWCWCRQSDIANISTGMTPLKSESKFYENGNIPWITSSLTNNEYIENAEYFITEYAIENTSLTLYPKNTLILAMYGQGKTRGQISEILIPATINQACAAIELFLDDEYFRKYIKLFHNWNYNNVRKEASGSAQPNLNLGKVQSTVIPLPPLAEQKRIVAAIEKFMPLIEEYGKKETQLKAINEQIGALTKKAILQEAVQGKIVPQIASEGNARDLLEEIKKERLSHGLDFANAKSGKRKSKKETALAGSNPCDITEDEVPFDIPENWCWCKIEDITIPIGNKNNQIQSKDVLKDGKIPVVSQGQNLIDGYSNETEKVINNIPVIMFGDHTRNVKYIDFPFIIGADGTKFFKPILCNKYYIYYLITFISLKLRNRGYARHYSLLKEEWLPLPPLAEQKRIVAAIEKMLPLCEKLGE